ncbi:MAG TPA: CCA tRNA nucleotidyltransferase, partial [Sphingomonas sp.]|nr:CCA tRNA nucleotidyltransferase [Sphingomonas sp.]
QAMLAGSVLAPVLPEIGATDRLAALIEAGRAAGAVPDGLRRLAALLPRDPATAESVAARLRLSNAERKRLALAAGIGPEANPKTLAYRIGVTSAVDRLLLANRPEDAAAVADWQPPRLPITGGDLIALGLKPGPVVARTLQAVETRWIEQGFPEREAVEALAREAVAAALNRGDMSRTD